MGREIKQVPLDFNWPLGLEWKGFVSPYTSQECRVCDGTGYNPETKKIADDWYDFAHTGARWDNKLTQDEVDALVNAGRLYDFTHDWVQGTGWVEKTPKPVVTAEFINERYQNGIGHDVINRWICVETRAKRLGVWGHCPVCGGEGEIWFNDAVKKLSSEWYDKERYEPPTGDGWQVWETVSDGSPISPVFATSDELVSWLVSEGHTESAARAFVESEYAPSMIVSGGVIYSNIDACEELKPKTKEG